jgi:hypothetical protein
VTGKTLQKVDFDQVRGLEGVRSAVVPLRMLCLIGMAGLRAPRSDIVD